MTIHPIAFGVFATLFTELVILFGYAIYVTFLKK